jgi:hypothetical protein
MLKYPNMRNELREFLGETASSSRPPFTPIKSDDDAYRESYSYAQMAMSFILDDISVLDNAESMLGVFLKSIEEVHACVAVGEAMMRYLEAERQNDRPLQSSTWNEVRSASAATLMVMARNDK